MFGWLKGKQEQLISQAFSKRQCKVHPVPRLFGQMINFFVFQEVWLFSPYPNYILLFCHFLAFL
jgi:hypothetical protein